MRTETKIVLAVCGTFLACVMVCMATIFLVATMTLKERQPVEPLYRIQALPGSGYPGPAPSAIPEPIAPPRPSSEKEREP